jgi:hypothetical protein
MPQGKVVLVISSMAYDTKIQVKTVLLQLVQERR